MLTIFIKAYCVNVVVKGALSSLRQFLATESTLKMMKMLFILFQKLFSSSGFLKLSLEFSAMPKNGLIKKIRLTSKFMTSQPGYQTVAIHILSNISRSKSNQAMKFGQLIRYKMRNIFLENSYPNCGGDTIPRPFSKKLKLSISLDH